MGTYSTQRWWMGTVCRTDSGDLTAGPNHVRVPEHSETEGTAAPPAEPLVAGWRHAAAEGAVGRRSPSCICKDLEHRNSHTGGLTSAIGSQRKSSRRVLPCPASHPALPCPTSYPTSYPAFHTNHMPCPTLPYSAPSVSPHPSCYDIHAHAPAVPATARVRMMMPTRTWRWCRTSRQATPPAAAGPPTRRPARPRLHQCTPYPGRPKRRPALGKLGRRAAAQ